MTRERNSGVHRDPGVSSSIFPGFRKAAGSGWAEDGSACFCAMEKVTHPSSSLNTAEEGQHRLEFCACPLL